MWQKLASNVSLQSLMIFAIKPLGSPLFRMISFKTPDGILHLCSFETLKDMKTIITPDINFTVWGWE